MATLRGPGAAASTRRKRWESSIFDTICQIKTEPPGSRAMAEASFGFQMAGRQIRRIVALT
jgi:hypothetical protein